MSRAEAAGAFLSSQDLASPHAEHERVVVGIRRPWASRRLEVRAKNAPALLQAAQRGYIPTTDAQARVSDCPKHYAGGRRTSLFRSQFRMYSI